MISIVVRSLVRSLVFLSSLAIAEPQIINLIKASKDNPDYLVRIKNSLDSGANANAEDQSGKTALSWAIFANSPETLSLLLRHGADPNKRNRDDIGPLDDAAYKATFDRSALPLVKILLKAGARINATNQKGITALMTTVVNAKDEQPLTPVIEFLLKNGADPNLGATFDPAKIPATTPIMYAAGKGKVNIARTLVKYGADVWKKGLNGKTAIDSAQESGFTDLADELRRVRKR